MVMSIAELREFFSLDRTPLAEYDDTKFSCGEPGYRPYCGGCSTMKRMRRGEDAFHCDVCKLVTRIVNGEDMFDRTAPVS